MEALDLVDALCELQEAAVAADASEADHYNALHGGGNGNNGHHHQHHLVQPGIGGAPAAAALDPKLLCAPHVAAWVESARDTLLRACVAALAKHGVSGAAMDDAYREVRGCYIST